MIKSKLWCDCKISLAIALNDDLKTYITEFWSTLPNDYFIRNELYYIAWHAASLCQSSAIELPVVSARYSERLEANMVFVFAAESRDLLTKVMLGFDELELNIIQAQLQASQNGFALYSFNATTADQGALRETKKLDLVERHLRQALLRPATDKLIARRSASRALKHFPIDTKIIFTQGHVNYTVMEVIAQDQPGLLHNVALILQRHKLKAVSAKITTFGERAEDVFFIQLPGGTPVTDEAILDSLEQDLRDALNRHPATAQRSRVA